MSSECLAGAAAGAAVAPADGEAVRVAHVHVGDVVQAVRDHLRGGADEPVDALVDLAPAEAHRHAAVEIHLPGAALVEAQRRDAHARLEHAPLRRQVALRDLRLGALGAAQARQLRRDVRGSPDEQLAAGVEQARFAPARGGGLLDHGDVQAVRPAPLHSRMIDPGQRLDRALDARRGPPT